MHVSRVNPSLVDAFQFFQPVQERERDLDERQLLLGNRAKDKPRFLNALPLRYLLPLVLTVLVDVRKGSSRLVVGHLRRTGTQTESWQKILPCGRVLGWKGNVIPSFPAQAPVRCAKRKYLQKPGRGILDSRHNRNVNSQAFGFCWMYREQCK